MCWARARRRDHGARGISGNVSDVSRRVMARWAFAANCGEPGALAWRCARPLHQDMHGDEACGGCVRYVGSTSVMEPSFSQDFFALFVAFLAPPISLLCRCSRAPRLHALQGPSRVLRARRCARSLRSRRPPRGSPRWRQKSRRRASAAVPKTAEFPTPI
jgi:hypothetical protein